SFTGIVAPAGVAPAIVARLNAAINDSLKAPSVQATLTELAVDIRAGTPADFAVFLAREREKWLAAAQAAQVRLDYGCAIDAVRLSLPTSTARITFPCRGRVGSPKAIRGGVAAYPHLRKHALKRCHPHPAR